MVRSKGETPSEVAMSRVIYFRIGDKDRLSLNALVRTLRNVQGLLYDFDAAISRDPRGSIRWEVAVLEKKSPTVIGVVGRPVQRNALASSVIHTNPEQVESALLDSTARLSLKAERTTIVSDSALERYRQLAMQSAKLGEIDVYTDAQLVPINERTLDNIKQLTGTKTRSTGSVLGNLDTISVHKANEIRVWDENTKRPVRCR